MRPLCDRSLFAARAYIKRPGFFCGRRLLARACFKGHGFFLAAVLRPKLICFESVCKETWIFFGRSAAAALLARIDIKGHRFFFCGRSAASAYLLREQMLREMDFFNVIYADRLFFTYWDLSFDAFIKPSSYVEVAVPK